MNDLVRSAPLTAMVPEVTIAIDRDCAALHLLGQVTFPYGYPVEGHHGDEVAVYSLRYADGQTEDLPVRNGIEVAQANLIYLASRITSCATAAQPALEFVKDIVREQYQVLLWSIPVAHGAKLSSSGANSIAASPRLQSSRSQPNSEYRQILGIQAELLPDDSLVETLMRQLRAAKFITKDNKADSTEGREW